MAAPLKRICRPAARQASRCRTQSSNRQCAAESLQCLNTRLSWSPPTSLRQHRLYSQTRPLHREFFAANSAETRDDDDGLESLPSESDLSSTAYAELEQHRELREMVRLAAWEMPLLTSLAKPHEEVSRTEMPLRWRYTTYFGEPHPASRKVVVEFQVRLLGQNQGMNEKQMVKFRKLAGPRYRVVRDLVRMSCDSFETQAQNKRFLGDVIQRLVAEAKDPEADSFEDIPLDTRHRTFKEVLRFPEEWKITPKRRAELDEMRRTLLLEEGRRVEENSVVSGAAAIEAARQAQLQQVEEPVMVQARQPLAKGRQGRREMGQTRGAQR